MATKRIQVLSSKRPKLVATKKTTRQSQSSPDDLSGQLFGRIATILDQARSHTARTVNHVMVFAYWHIGQEITQQIQEGSARAAYGQQVMTALSAKLRQRYGRGFSLANLRLFRQFYQCYADRRPIRYSPSRELADPEIRYLPSSELTQGPVPQGFHPGLTWTH